MLKFVFKLVFPGLHYKNCYNLVNHIVFIYAKFRIYNGVNTSYKIETDISLVCYQITDTKTATELGKLSYNLSALLDKPNLELDDQPLSLKSSGPDSSVMISMRLRVSELSQNFFFIMIFTSVNMMDLNWTFWELD